MSVPKWNGIVVSDGYFRYLVRTMLRELEQFLSLEALK